MIFSYSTERRQVMSFLRVRLVPTAVHCSPLQNKADEEDATHKVSGFSDTKCCLCKGNENSPGKNVEGAVMAGALNSFAEYSNREE